MPYGLQAMLKDGHKHMSGMEDAVFRNIEACKQLSVITKTSMGPNGTQQMPYCLLYDLRALQY